jgi:transposase
MYYVGLDAHTKTSTLHILDEDHRRVKRETFRGTLRELLRHVRDLPRPFKICFEASCGYGYLHDELCKIADQVLVAHPGKLRLIYRSKRKNDRLDAEKLAVLLHAGAIPPVHVPGESVRQWRGMIEHRQRLVRKRTSCKNAIRALLRTQALTAPKGLWTGKGRRWLTALSLSEPDALRRDMLLEDLEHLDRQVARLTKALDQIGKCSPAVMHLRTIPGVGPRTAEAIVAYMDRPERFGRSAQVGAYFGLVPCQDASAGRNRLGHITREGPATARRMLTEATWQVIRRCPSVRARFERIMGGRTDRRKVALVATAHWLVRCMWAMLRSGEEWRHTA